MYCKRCRKIFSDGYLGMCRDCMRELDDVVAQVREFLKKEKTANIPEICEKTEIAEKDILYLLKIGRLVLETPSAMYTCKKCGKPISTGKYCDACSHYLGNLLSDAAKKMDPNDNRNGNSRNENESDKNDGANPLNLYWRKHDKRV